MNSWGTYLFAAGVLVLLFTPALGRVVTDSREGADLRNLDGLRAVIDALSPGTVAHFSYGVAQVSDSIRLGGRMVACSYGNGTLSEGVTWLLPGATLLPSVQYSLSLVQGAVTVTRDV